MAATEQDFFAFSVLNLVLHSYLSNAVYTEQQYPQDGYRGKKADGLYMFLQYFKLNCLLSAKSKLNWSN